MTPRRLFGYQDLIARNRKSRYIELLQLHAKAASGEAKEINKQIAAWEKEV